MPAEMLLDLSGNKYNPNEMSDWQDTAVELYQGGKALMPYVQEGMAQVTDLYRSFVRQSNRYFTPPQTLVAPGYGGEPIKGPAGNSTLSNPPGSMVYGRQSMRTRYARPYNRLRKRTGLSKGMATAVRKIAKKAVTTMSEKKYINYIQAATQPTTAGVITSLSDTAQGDGDAGFREGDQIRLFDLELRGQVLAATGTDVLRVIVFYWKPGFAAVPPSFALLLQAAPYINSAKQMDEDRMPNATILFDRTFCSSTVDETLDTFAVKIPLTNHKVNYLGGSTTNQQNGLYIGYVNRSGNASLQFTGMVRYTDP